MKHPYTLALLPLLAACGSGGGDGATDTPDPVVPPTEAVCGYTDTSGGYLASNVDQLQALLDTLANNGQDDTIYLAAGTYSVNAPLTYDFHTGNGEKMEKISLIGCGMEQTIFDGNDTSRVFNFWKNGPEIDEDQVHMGPNPGLHMEAMTIRNGRCIGECSDIYGNSGAGIHVQRYDTELVRVALVDNYDINEGSALNGAGHTVLKEVKVAGNQSGTAVSVCGRLTVSGSLFAGNAGGGLYRGICLDGDYSEFDVTIGDSRFEGNGGHGGLQVLGGTTPGQLTIEDSEFVDNRSLNAGGAALLTRHGNLTVRNSVFSNNRVMDDHQECSDYSMDCQSGGALFIDNWFPGGGQTRIEGSSFTNNSAPDAGGALFLGGGQDCERDPVRGYEHYCRPDDYPAPLPSQQSLLVINSRFSGNRANDGADLIIAKMELQGGFQSGNVSLTNSDLSQSQGNSSMVIGGDLTLSASTIDGSVRLSGEFNSDGASGVGTLIQR